VTTNAATGTQSNAWGSTSGSARGGAIAGGASIAGAAAIAPVSRIRGH
jgi:hypothetical protein